MTKAHALFTAVPKLHNCAQAVVEGGGGSPELIAEMAACGGGRAPGGLCGALHGALMLCPEKAEEIKAAFAAEVGALTCREIKAEAKTPCPMCVEAGAKIVEALLAKN